MHARTPHRNASAKKTILKQNFIKCKCGWLFLRTAVAVVMFARLPFDSHACYRRQGGPSGDEGWRGGAVCGTRGSWSWSLWPCSSKSAVAEDCCCCSWRARCSTANTVSSTTRNAGVPGMIVPIYIEEFVWIPYQRIQCPVPASAADFDGHTATFFIYRKQWRKQSFQVQISLGCGHAHTICALRAFFARVPSFCEHRQH